MIPRWPAPAAAPARPASFPNSVRRPARPSGAATPAASPSTISSASEEPQRPLQTGPLMHDFHRLTIAEVKHETSEAISVRLHIPAALAPLFRFKPGQHLAV